MNVINLVTSFFLQKRIIGPIIVLSFGFIIIRILMQITKRIIIRGKTQYEIKRRNTIVKLIQNFIKYIIYFLIIIIILNIYEVDTKSLLASLGIAGAVLGLALQSTIEDLISGIFIILDNYFVIGDIVTYNDFTGEIIEMGLKNTKIKKVSGEVYVIANRNISSIINLSQQKANLIIKVSTAYEESTEKVEKILKKIVENALNIPEVYKESKYLGIDEMTDHAINYAISISCKQDMQWQIKREMLKQIKLAYEKENIKIPYPQIEVHNGKKI